MRLDYCPHCRSLPVRTDDTQYPFVVQYACGTRVRSDGSLMGRDETTDICAQSRRASSKILARSNYGGIL